MGSVIESIQCPRCNEEACMDFYYKTGEEYIFCDNCGYSRSVEIINREKRLDELKEEDIKVEENKNPYGAFRLEVRHNIGMQLGTLNTEEDAKEFEKAVNNDPELRYAHISRFVNGVIEKTILIDEGPDYDSAGFTKEDELPF